METIGFIIGMCLLACAAQIAYDLLTHNDGKPSFELPDEMSETTTFISGPQRRTFTSLRTPSNN